MPSIQQINPNKTAVAEKKKRKSKFFAAIKVVLFFSLIIGWYLYRDMPKVIKIPDNTWETRNSGKFSNLFEDQYKKIIWFGADCPVSARKKKTFDDAIKFRGLDSYYFHRPYLQSSMYVQCETDECMDMFILKHCSEGACLIMPRHKKIIKTKYENLFRDAEKYKNF